MLVSWRTAPLQIILVPKDKVARYGFLARSCLVSSMNSTYLAGTISPGDRRKTPMGFNQQPDLSSAAGAPKRHQGQHLDPARVC